MFTGLVEELGIMSSIQKGADSARLNIKAEKVMEGMSIGDSIAVNGVCLTATSIGKGYFTADVMFETLNRTNLAKLKPGERLNLERALRVGDRLGGHLVSGHIDEVGVITRKEKKDIAILITISASKEVMRYLIKKGSIAVDGTSLTVVDLVETGFTVSIIPHTAKATVLGYKEAGDLVNLEGDIIGKYIERLLKAGEIGNSGRDTGVDMQTLLENGFM